MQLRTYTSPLGHALRNLEGPCGPREMSKCLWQILRESSIRPFKLTRASLEQMVSLAYHASMAAEEGRLPRFALMMCSENSEPAVTARLEVALSDVEALRRLAPTCASEEDTLWVEERGGRLYVRGLATLPPQITMRYQSNPIPVSSGTDFVLRVLGPGRLRATLLAVNVELGGAKLSVRLPWWFLPEVRAPFTRAAGRVSTEVVSIHEGTLPPYFDADHLAGRLSPILQRAFGNALGQMVKQGHGGCIVIVPQMRPALSKFIKIKYPATGVDLAKAASDVGNQWLVDSATPPGPFTGYEGTREAIARWKVQRLGETLARGASVDGCVVLSHQLELVGFGGVIQAGRVSKAMAKRPLQAAPVGTVVAIEEALNKVGGTRHRSALFLCASLPGAIAFVVSQDGDLKVFWSTATETHAVQGLSPDY